MPKLHMIAVDLWAPQEPRPGVYDAETYSNWDHEGTYKNFKATCDKYFPSRVQIMRMDTKEAHKLVEDGSLDFVFIDADHTYEGCAADIANWTPKVRQGGLIAGHDINWPGVLKAVKESGDFQTAPSDNVWLRGQATRIP